MQAQNEQLKKEILDILVSGGEREDVCRKLMSLIQAITDPENQPNQYGIKL
jgi:Trp operon repressor